VKGREGGGGAAGSETIARTRARQSRTTTTPPTRAARPAARATQPPPARHTARVHTRATRPHETAASLAVTVAAVVVFDRRDAAVRFEEGGDSDVPKHAREHQWRCTASCQRVDVDRLVR